MDLKSTEASILSYWRNSVADGNRMDIDSNRLSQAYTLEDYNLEGGKIPQEPVNYLFQYKLKLINQYIKNKITIEDLSVITVLISPFYIIPTVEHSEQRKNRNPMPVYPLWLPAVLDKEGLLKPPETNIKPWMNRMVLEPVNNYRVSVILSSVDKVDNFLTHNEVPKDSWTEYWAYCRKFFTEVTGKNWADIKENNFVSANFNKILLDTESHFVTSAILKLYDFLRDEKELPNLFKRFSSPKSPSLKTILNESDIMAISCKHVGHMNYQFQLASSQRQALYHLIELKDGEILAVNGPPGTGKTTLLQNVIANLFVEKALEDKDPPIIVATSNNNQAITNILYVFGQAKTKNGKLEGRWLPDITSYGLYLPSKNYRENIHDIPSTTPFGDGFPKTIENKEYYHLAKSYYLKKFYEYSNKQSNDVKFAVKWLHQELSLQCKELKKGFDCWQKKELLASKIQRFEKFGGINNYIGKLNQKHNDLIHFNDIAKKVRTTLLEIEKSESIWSKFFSFLSSVKRRRAAKYQLIFSDFPIEINKVEWSDITTIYNFLKDTIEHTNISIRESQKVIKLIKKLLLKNSDSILQWKTWKNDNNLNSDFPDLLDELDTSIRHVAFQLATHYWEGRWLVECEGFLFNQQKEHSQKKHENKWRRYAMVTPCFITTFFMLPRFFNYPVRSDDGYGYTNLPHLEYIDLLIVDEAGQVSPEIGGVSFALAKKAIVLGDVYQIEPIWRVYPSVDAGNLEVAEIINDRKDQNDINIIDDFGLTASKGSVMKVACSNTPWKIEGQDSRGLLLTEHRRCLPEIISYCNELVYKGTLKPLRKCERSLLFPKVGYAHVNGVSKLVGGSRENHKEAYVIAAWLKKNKDAIENYYNKKIFDTVGIITPFAAQARKLKKEIISAGIKIEGFKIGTVHTLQGAEREIIIFSPVYCINNRGSRYFFDQGPNMLNVAVSRAKDSFLVFGEMSLFDPNANTPSGLLAHYLFRKETNEILDLPLPIRIKTIVPRRISTLEDHRSVLTQVLEQAAEQVIIVSPFISIFAIEADNLLYKIKSATDRGVVVIVYTDAFLDKLGNKLKNLQSKDVMH